MKPYPEHVRAEALRLRDEEGLGYKRIARRLGVPQTTIFRWLKPNYEIRTRMLSREAKRRRTGICEDCGVETRYNGHTAPVSRLCLACATVRSGAAAKVWTRARIIAAIQWWSDAYGRAPAIPDFSPTHCRYLKDREREARARRHTDARQIPSFTTVVLEFGTWNTAIAAAGLQPLAPNGGGGNQLRRRKVAA